MADLNVDRIIYDNSRKLDLERVWFELTKTMFRTFSYHEVFDKTILASDYALVKETNKNKKRVGKFIRSEARKLIDKEHTISSIAEGYGIKVKGNKMICPFHEDKDPSLSFDDEKGYFNCFGCNVKGDVIEFKRRLMELGDKKRRRKKSVRK